MKKRYQVFVSSTFKDLTAERQAAVEAILKSGHIPAGMELFTAGDQSQMEVIHQWIEESDIYMLILGARYGSIEPTSGLSYTELEFNYAVQLGKPFFSVVLTEEGREAKVKQHGSSVLETDNPEKYRGFRQNVMSKLCAFFSSPQDVKMAVLETLPRLTTGKNLVGWISAAEAQADGTAGQELIRLSQENEKLREEIAALKKKTDTNDPYDDLYQLLSTKKLVIPAKLTKGEEMKTTLLDMMLVASQALETGVTNAHSANADEMFMYHHIAAPLAALGLVEEGKVPANVLWTRLKLSKEGVKFVSWASIKQSKRKKAKKETGKAAASKASK